MGKEERYYKHDFMERIGHWVHVVNILLLVFSGLQIHNPSWAFFGSMSNARFVHFLSTYTFLFIGIWHLYYFFGAKKHTDAFFMPEDAKDIIPTLKWYLFLSDTRPDYTKYNVLQKISYAGLFVISAFQALLGFALYWNKSMRWFTDLMGGMLSARALHYSLTWIFVYFTAVHFYLVVREDIQLLWAMVHGYYHREAKD
jgi:Ni/Fe-hydrogenase 1 B-type cytochrome subunit